MIVNTIKTLIYARPAIQRSQKMTKRKNTLVPKAQKKRAKPDNLEDYSLNIIKKIMLIYVYTRKPGIEIIDPETNEPVPEYQRTYGGQTSRDMEEREKQHENRKETFFDQCFTKENRDTAWEPVEIKEKIEYEAKVYIDKETHEVVYIDISDGCRLGNEREKHWIKTLNSTQNGFNRTFGGQHGKEQAWMESQIIKSARHDIAMYHAVQKYRKYNKLENRYILVPLNTLLDDGTKFGKQICKFREKHKKGKVLPSVVDELNKIGFVWDQDKHHRVQNTRFLQDMIEHGNYTSLSDIKRSHTFTGDIFADGTSVPVDLVIVKNVGDLISKLKEGRIDNYTAEQQMWLRANGLGKPENADDKRANALQDTLLRAEWCIKIYNKIPSCDKRFDTHDDEGNVLPHFMVNTNPGMDKARIRNRYKKNNFHYPEQFMEKMKDISSNYFD